MFPEGPTRPGPWACWALTAASAAEWDVGAGHGVNTRGEHLGEGGHAGEDQEA